MDACGNLRQWCCGTKRLQCDPALARVSNQQINRNPTVCPVALPALWFREGISVQHFTEMFFQWACVLLKKAFWPQNLTNVFERESPNRQFILAHSWWCTSTFFVCFGPPLQEALLAAWFFPSFPSLSFPRHAFLWLSCKLKTLAVFLSHRTLQKWTSFVRMNFPSPLTCETLIIQRRPPTEGRSITTIAEKAPPNDTGTLLPSQIWLGASIQSSPTQCAFITPRMLSFLVFSIFIFLVFFFFNECSSPNSDQQPHFHQSNASVCPELALMRSSP